jgi:hypothetical protein
MYSFFFLWEWDLNSWLHTCKGGSLPVELFLQSSLCILDTLKSLNLRFFLAFLRKAIKISTSQDHSGKVYITCPGTREVSNK